MLMDSIWQEKSLDLNLIPYGCISTGHNVGREQARRSPAGVKGLLPKSLRARGSGKGLELIRRMSPCQV